jgi:hypothetical protein
MGSPGQPQLAPSNRFSERADRDFASGPKRSQYRGYRIEATLAGPAGWRVSVFRLSTKVPAPPGQSSLLYASARAAIGGGVRAVDWLLGPPRLS